MVMISISIMNQQHRMETEERIGQKNYLVQNYLVQPTLFSQCKDGLKRSGYDFDFKYEPAIQNGNRRKNRGRTIPKPLI